MNQKSKSIECPCGGGRYDKCCGRFIDEAQVAASASDLMRSRYTAFVLRNEAYLRTTWWPETLPEEAVAGEAGIKWIGLKIVEQRQAAGADEATVEFIARFKVGGRAHKLHEISNFARQADAAGIARWYYVDGVFPEH